MSDPHSRDLSRWRQAYTQGASGTTPSLDRILQPTVIVDDVSHLAPPIRLPTFSAFAFEGADATRYGIVQLFPPPEGCYVAFYLRGSSVSLGMKFTIRPTAGDLITAGKTTINTANAFNIDGPSRSVFEHGLTTVDPDTTLGALHPQAAPTAQQSPYFGPWFMPNGYAMYVWMGLTNQVVGVVAEWIEFPSQALVTGA